MPFGVSPLFHYARYIVAKGNIDRYYPGVKESHKPGMPATGQRCRDRRSCRGRGRLNLGGQICLRGGRRAGAVASMQGAGGNKERNKERGRICFFYRTKPPDGK